MHNPYQAPVADLDNPLAAEGGSAPNVGGFWIRVAAQLLDFLFLLPIVGLTFWLSSLSRYFYAIWVIPGTMIGMFLTVYLVRRYGGTPGKLVLKLRIQMKDGERISVKAALLRAAPMLALSVTTNVGNAYAAVYMNNAEYMSMGFMQRSAMLGAAAPSWSTLAQVLMQIWVLGCVVVMLFNKRRRTIHDFLAGTVVVKAGGA